MTYFWIALALVVVAVVAYAVGRRSRRGGDLGGEQLAGRTTDGGRTTEGDVETGVRREATGLGVAEDAAERMPVEPRTAMELDDLAAQVREMKQRGDVIRAIKLVRATTGLGLKDAKDFVDGL